MDDVVGKALPALVPGGVGRGETARDGRNLRWIEVGSGAGPAVVLVAGRGEVILDWATILPPLSLGSRVRAYDRAGLGTSDPVSPLTLQAEIDDLAAILTETGPAVLVAHSWGGLLAQLVACTHPRSIAGLVLIDPSHEDIWASVPWPIRTIEAAIGPTAVMLQSLGLSSRIAKRTGRRMAARCSEDPRTSALIVDAYVASYASRSHARMVRDEGRLAVRSAPLARAARTSSALPDVPLVVLSATTGLPPRMRARVSAIHAQITASTRRGYQTIVDDAGHYIHHDQPETVITAIRAVIDASTAEDTIG
jgi:pimeloyl-ACP methyl ester carboxylesterase